MNEQILPWGMEREFLSQITEGKCKRKAPQIVSIKQQLWSMQLLPRMNDIIKEEQKISELL